MRQQLLEFFHDQGGATAVEYSLIAAAIAAVILAVVLAIGQKTRIPFEDVSTNMP